MSVPTAGTKATLQNAGKEMTIQFLLTTLLFAQLLFAPASCGAAPDHTEHGTGEGQSAARETTPEQKTIAGRVVAVADGDTITVLDRENRQHRIRLAGIDAPESSQDFGQAAKKNLSELVFDKAVKVTYSKLDRYSRVLGVVRVGQLEVNLAQVAVGYAWHYKEYQNEQTPEQRTAYAAAETRARRERKGLWQQPNPVKPSEYRRAGRNE